MRVMLRLTALGAACLCPKAKYSLERLSRNSDWEFTPVHDLDPLQLFLRCQSGVQFILQFRRSQSARARISQRYGGRRQLRSVGLARSVHAGVKYRAMLMKLLLYKETIDRSSGGANHIHFAVRSWRAISPVKNHPSLMAANVRE